MSKDDKTQILGGNDKPKVEKTRIYTPENKGKATAGGNEKKPLKGKKQPPKGSDPKVINLAAAVGFGALAGMGSMYMFGSDFSADGTQSAGFFPGGDSGEAGEIDLNQPPEIATVNTTDMTYMQAWTAAREDVGPGGIFEFGGGMYSTFNQEEWSSLTPEQHEQFWANLPTLQEVEAEVIDAGGNVDPDPEPDASVDVIIYDEAPVALEVTEDMSFAEAFATAREEVGAGGIFLWNGQMYGTYYETESASMTSDDRQAWADSLPSMSGLEEYVAIHQENLGAEIEILEIEDGEEIIAAGDEEIPDDPFADIENPDAVEESSGEDIFDPTEDVVLDDDFIIGGGDEIVFDDDISYDDDIDDLA